ncbi:hypothetical protein OIDMADRAFT_124659, partial [Oidiodendron maius Zn]
DLSLSTSLLIGALLQCILVLALPPVYALTPAFLILVVRTIDTLLITNGIKPNPYLHNVFPKRTTAQVLDKNGNFSGAGQEKIAVLLLGAKTNHPMGVFAPDFPKLGEYNQSMVNELQDPNSQDNGFLGYTTFTKKDERGATETLMISYWRSVEHVHAYAHSPLHEKAWLWWDRSLAGHKHIGIYHEVFESPKGMWEGIYINFQPTLLGATTYLKKDGELEGGEVKHEWVSGLLDANRGRMKTSNGRRGQKGRDTDEDKFGANYYEDNAAN